ncbi:hypothetical protein KSF73_13080 [Burkholderiaceae bacterium DAT-1]|nr:hypothetical protein [Burkholderiaceae bacterium DAT-1]
MRHLAAFTLLSCLAGVPNRTLAAPPAPDNAPLTLYTGELPAPEFVPPRLKEEFARSTNLLQRTFNEQGIPFTMVRTDWSRALNRTRREANACLFSAARLPEREPWFVWIGPIEYSYDDVFGHAGSPPLRSLDELRDATVCALMDDAPGRQLTALGYRVAWSSSLDTCVLNVARGMSQYWVTDRNFGEIAIRKLKLENEVVSVMQLAKKPLYLACNPAVPKETLARIRKGLNLPNH